LKIVMKKFGSDEEEKKPLPTTLEEFAELHGLTMEVRERSKRQMQFNGGLSRYFASFDRVEVMEGGMLSCQSGNGDTPAEAIAAYLPTIVGQRIVVNAMRPSRKEIDVPNELTFTGEVE
jgi:hypothetical protein